MWALVKPEVARAPNQQSVSGLVEKVHHYIGYTVYRSHAFELFAKYGEAWLKKVVFRREILYVYSAKTRKFGCRACAQSTSVFCHKRTRLKSPSECLDCLEDSSHVASSIRIFELFTHILKLLLS